MSSVTDLELLRQYEPILRFTQGETFFPTAVEPYVRRCGLWSRLPDREPQMLVPPGKLDLTTLAQYDTNHPESTLFLRFVQRPLTGLAYRNWVRRRGRSHFQALGRLARVGLGARLVDALFSLSLLVRGSVPGGTAAAATQQYREILEECPNYAYYGRVIREADYIVLHYLFFYVMNDWRSSFHGANDHEADWEQVFVYLEECEDGPPTPAWVAYAAHNSSGDDLRRRWDDPELDRVDTHPVVYVSAGSHAGYFLPGEYLTRVELAFLQPLLDAAQIVERLWRNWLQQGDPHKLTERVESFISVPFVDYARGDGLAIGPGQSATWTPILVTDEADWIERYRGRWGLDARDPFAGESAPGGPKYNYLGAVRQTWHDPLGWAGLNKVTPSFAVRPTLLTHITELEHELATIDQQVGEMRDALRRQEVEIWALQETGRRRELYEERQNRLFEQEEEVEALLQRRAELVDTIQACHRYLEQEEAGERGDPQAHIRHKRRPQTERERRRSVLAEVWASVSVGLLLISMGSLALLGEWAAAVALPAGVFVVVEAVLHGRIKDLLVNTTVILAVFATAILVYEFFWYLILASVVVVAALVITDNIREMRGY